MKTTNKLKWYRWVAVPLLVLTLGLGLGLAPAKMLLSGSGIVSLSAVDVGVSAATIPEGWWQDANLHNGLWYQDINNPTYITQGSTTYQVSYMKIYSLSSTMRVMEVSTYPRAYVDKDPHIYTIDTPFTVGQDDLNDYYNSQYAQEGGYQYRPEIEDGTNVFVDSRQLVFLTGETAMHYQGDPLPGSFPMWIESESLPTPTTETNYDNFPIIKQALVGQLASCTLLDGYWKRANNTTWRQVNANVITTMNTRLAAGDAKFRITRLGTATQRRIVIRMLYEKVIKP